MPGSASRVAAASAGLALGVLVVHRNWVLQRLRLLWLRDDLAEAVLLVVDGGVAVSGGSSSSECMFIHVGGGVGGEVRVYCDGGAWGMLRSLVVVWGW
jgi:hypothetical protein